jgi:hypothetical protein
MNHYTVAVPYRTHVKLWQEFIGNSLDWNWSHPAAVKLFKQYLESKWNNSYAFVYSNGVVFQVAFATEHDLVDFTMRYL